jgi:hypothetical protein
MSISYFLSADSYICLDRRYCIFLDARSDKYMVTSRQTIDCLAPWLHGWRTEFSSVAENTIPPHLETIAEDFVREGIFTKLSHLGKPLLSQDIERPTQNMRTALNSPRLWSALVLGYASIRSSLWASERLSRHSLLSTIRAVRERRAACSRSPHDVDVLRTSSLVEVFKRWHILFSRPHACLYDSLSLLHFLSAFNIFPSLVFGVIPDPFQAHCWLQCNTMVINDSVSHVSNYTPIMLV